MIDSCKKETETWETSEVNESWSWASEAKEERSTLTEADEKRLLNWDSKFKITESGLLSRPRLRLPLIEVLSSAIDGESKLKCTW